MSKLAIDALRAERQLVLDLAATLNPADWETPSDCAGWRVQDVIAHMAATFHGIADPSSNGDGDPGTNDAEKLAEIPVGVRRSWSSADVLSEYSEWSAKAIDALASMQEPPLADMVIPLANLGSHPMHILANALVFDHYCHLRHDLLAPHGPLERAELASDDLRLRPTMDWMLAGLPQMCADALRVVDRPINLVFSGPGGGQYTLCPAAPEDEFTRLVNGVDPSSAATVESTAHDFVCWGTQRRSWRDLGVKVTGDVDYAALVLDAINVI